MTDEQREEAVQIAMELHDVVAIIWKDRTHIDWEHTSQRDPVVMAMELCIDGAKIQSTTLRGALFSICRAVLYATHGNDAEVAYNKELFKQMCKEGRREVAEENRVREKDIAKKRAEGR